MDSGAGIFRHTLGPAPRRALGCAAGAILMLAPALARAQAALPDLDQQADARFRTAAIIGGEALAIGLYGKAKWWQDGFTSHFRSANEGWFGQSTYAGGADKLGHFYINYTGTRLMKHAFIWAGNSPSDALRLAAWSTLGMFAAVEVLDGWSRQWHFSREDMVMNALGAGSALLFERHPGLDRLIDLRIQYWPSHEEGASFDPFGDYSGQTYLLVVKGSGIDAMRGHPLLRYLELAAGYGTRGYTGTPNQSGTRNIYVGVSLNLSALLNGRHRTDASRMRRVAQEALEYVQVPGTAALARIKLDQH